MTSDALVPTDGNGLPLHNRKPSGCGPDVCDECSYAAHDWVAWPCAGDSGSGVVPDKPALAPEPTQPVDGHGAIYWHARWVNAQRQMDRMEVRLFAALKAKESASVPAVTDDEAATKVIESAVLLAGREWDRWPTHPKDIQPRFNFIAERVVAALRSAGFLIVHHTKET